MVTPAAEHVENGRFARTIVNRLWQRLMGRGIVRPVDAMQAEPWNGDLLESSNPASPLRLALAPKPN